MWCWLLTPLVIQSAGIKGINKVRKLTPGTGCQGLTGGRLEAKLFLALDLYHLTVMQGNFHSAKLQILQGLGNRSEYSLIVCRQAEAIVCGHARHSGIPFRGTQACPTR